MDLVICIGNEARGDDGAAREVARLLQDVPGLRVLSEPQLDVLMAEEVARAGHVTFVDAERRAAPSVRVVALEPRPLVARSTTHALDPEGLLALAEALYGPAPPAELITLAAPEMEHAGALSPTAATAAGEAAVLIRSRSPNP